MVDHAARKDSLVAKVCAHRDRCAAHPLVALAIRGKGIASESGLAGMKSVLLLTRDSAPPILYMAVANVAALTCGVLLVHAFRAFNGRPGIDRFAVATWASASLAFVVVFGLGEYEAYYRARASVLTLGLAVLFSLALAELVRGHALREEVSRKFMLFLLGLSALALWVRLVLLLLWSTNTGDMLAPGLERSLTLLPAVMVANGFGMALLLMHNGRLTAVALDLAARDPLTKLPNRRALVSTLQRCLPHGRSQGSPTGFLLLDIDHFKRINDTFGHQSGDEVLCRFAERVQKVLRPGDVLAWIGGEEFCVVLPGCATAPAESSAERIRVAVASTTCELSDGRSVHVTVSIGVTSTEDDLEIEWNRLHVRADQALYGAKSAGRNRTMLWQKEAAGDTA